VAGLWRPTAIDVHYASKHLYLSDQQTRKIQRVKLLEEPAVTEDFITDGLNKVEGLAVDWVGGNLYLADEGLQAIFVASLKRPELRRTLIRERTNHVRSIAVDPASGRLFWSNWNNMAEAVTTNAAGGGLPSPAAAVSGGGGSILWSWMDGSEPEVLLDYDLQWPNGLTFDPASSTLYWCDTFLNRIERLNLAGLLDGDIGGAISSKGAAKADFILQRRRSIVMAAAAGDDKLPMARPYGLTLHKRQLFYTEFVNGRIMRVDLDTNQTTVVMADLPQLFEVKAVTSGRQKARKQNNNDCDSLGCAELCLLVRAGGARCACREGFAPSGRNGTACTRNTTTTVAEPKAKSKAAAAAMEEGGVGGDSDAPVTSIGGGNVSCAEGEVACTNGAACISRVWLCDGDMVSTGSTGTGSTVIILRIGIEPRAFI
jgi:low density lipoprotein receptor-related protein 5/6